MKITSEVESFIVSNFLFGQAGQQLSGSQSLLQTGIVDSTGMLELVSFLEQTYGVTVEDRELVPENLDTLDNISRFVTGKLTVVSQG